MGEEGRNGEELLLVERTSGDRIRFFVSKAISIHYPQS